MKTNQPEKSGPLGIHSEFSKVLREQLHTQRGFELSEKGLMELKAMLSKHHYSTEHDCPPKKKSAPAWNNSDAQVTATVLNELEKKMRRKGAGTA